MANYQNKGIIIQRFNDAIRDLLQTGGSCKSK